MLTRLLALALVASAVAQETPRLEVRPVACHHEAPRQDNGLWRRRLSGQRAATPRFLGFEALTGFDSRAGLRDAPPPVLKLDGARVVMVGRILLLDEIRAMPQFLLCQDRSGDDWGQPPTLADMVHVHVPAAARIDFTEAPVRVQGTLRVKEQRDDGYLVAIYQLEAESVSVIE